MDRFAMLLTDLGTLIGMPLYPDQKRGCHLNIDQQLHIQIEEDSNYDRVLVAAFVSEIPPGTFREIVLKQALKENHLYPRIGTFSYSERNHQLSLFSHLYYTGLRGEMFADFLEQFIEKVKKWRMAIKTGSLPPLEKR